MKTNTLIIISLTLILSLFSFSMKASDWSAVADLKGSWYFSVGDDMSWSKVDVDVSNWDKISVPDNWDKYYEGYNGYGWYRKTFDARWMPDEGQLALFLGQIDDVDEVFINGIKIGQTGGFLPNLKSAWNFDRQYYIPENILKKTNNVIAVRVYDSGGPGGIVRGDKIGIYYDKDHSLLSQDLSGPWKFSINRQKGMFEKEFDDSEWKNIQVPGRWENQGFPDHDGYGWYRTSFSVSDKMKEESLYLILGKIDDTDKVYLNGEPFARTEYLEKYSRLFKYNSWRLYRVYKLPVSKLQKNNFLVVEVRDDQQGGGIYEGPIGIMTERNAKIIEERSEEDFWTNPIWYFFRNF